MRSAPGSHMAMQHFSELLPGIVFASSGYGVAGTCPSQSRSPLQGTLAGLVGLVKKDAPSMEDLPPEPGETASRITIDVH